MLHDLPPPVSAAVDEWSHLDYRFLLWETEMWFDKYQQSKSALSDKKKGHLNKCMMGLKESSLQDCAHLKWGDVPVALLHGAKVVSEVLWVGREAAAPVSAVDMVMVEPSLWIANTGFVLNICNELCAKLKFFITSSTILILILIFN